MNGQNQPDHPETEDLDQRFKRAQAHLQEQDPPPRTPNPKPQQTPGSFADILAQTMLTGLVSSTAAILWVIGQKNSTVHIDALILAVAAATLPYWSRGTWKFFTKADLRNATVAAIGAAGLTAAAGAAARLAGAAGTAPPLQLAYALSLLSAIGVGIQLVRYLDSMPNGKDDTR